jgi:hypothetical protein
MPALETEFALGAETVHEQLHDVLVVELVHSHEVSRQILSLDPVIQQQDDERRAVEDWRPGIVDEQLKILDDLAGFFQLLHQHPGIELARD